MKLSARCWLALMLSAAGGSFAQQANSAIENQPARHSPAWLTGGVIYELYPRTFSAEGNLNAITKRLDELKALGVNVIWLMPIHPNGQIKKKGTLGSPYAVRDYYAIDSAYGTKDDLRKLVREAHRRGLKITIDIVANHTSWDSVMMAHPDFYRHDKQGNIVSPYDWTDVAALDYSNPKLRRYMLDMLAYWIKDFDLDGYRCDAAAEVPTDFWEQARVELDRIKPDIMLLAEASKPDLLRSAFDIDYSWPVMSALNEVMMRGAPATAVHDAIEQQRVQFPKGALHMRVSDDHDEDRALVRYGMPGSLAASALMFTLDGVPLIYNGMEVGDDTESSGPALFESLKVLWQMTERRPQYAKFYAAMLPLRKEHPALRQGETVWLRNSDEQHVISYLRRSGSEEFLVSINFSGTPFHGTIEAPAGAWTPVELPTFKNRESSLPALSLDAFEFRIFQRQLTTK